MSFIIQDPSVESSNPFRFVKTDSWQSGNYSCTTADLATQFRHRRAALSFTDIAFPSVPYEEIKPCIINASKVQEILTGTKPEKAKEANKDFLFNALLTVGSIYYMLHDGEFVQREGVTHVTGDLSENSNYTQVTVLSGDRLIRGYTHIDKSNPVLKLAVSVFDCDNTPIDFVDYSSIVSPAMLSSLQNSKFKEVFVPNGIDHKRVLDYAARELAKVALHHQSGEPDVEDGVAYVAPWYIYQADNFIHFTHSDIFEPLEKLLKKLKEN